MKKLVFSVALFFISLPIFAEMKYPDAPLGLTWGITGPELEAKAGAVLQPTSIDKNVSIYSLKSPPMTLPGFNEYFVLVHKDLGAMKIVMNEAIESDTFGTKGKEEYFKYKEALSNKFGKPINSFEHVGMKIYKNSDEFYQCLNYDGCGYYGSVFENHVYMRLSGIKRGKGNLSINYESELFTKYNLDKKK